MASSRANEPVMHCPASDFAGILLLAKRMIKSGVYFNVDTFIKPAVLQTDFEDATKLLDDYTTGAKGDHKMLILRDEQSIIVHDMLSKLLLYVKPIVGNDVKLILLSGFDLNNQPEALPAPDQAVIDRIEKGIIDGTYKVFIVRKTNKKDVNEDSKTHLKNVKFYVEITTTPDIADSWKFAVNGEASTKLIFSNYTSMVINYIRVYGKNPTGKGQVSMIYSFLPQ